MTWIVRIATTLALLAPAHSASSQQPRAKFATGNTQLIVVVPCHGIEAITAPLPRSAKVPMGIFIDERRIGGVVTCSVAKVSVPTGEHAIRIGENTFTMLGLPPIAKRLQKFTGGQPSYVEVRLSQYGSAYFETITAAKAQTLISALPKNY